MAWLILFGLVIFIALHSLRSHFPAQREALIAQWGMVPFRVVYSVLTLLALACIGVGLIEARQAPVVLWQPDPAWRIGMGHGMWLVAVGVAASWVPGTHLKAWLKQPLLFAIVLWALLHLSVSAYLHQWIICLAILVWVVSVLWRDWHIAPAAPISFGRDIFAILLATAMWFVFGQYLHTWIIGVPIILF